MNRAATAMKGVRASPQSGILHRGRAGGRRNSDPCAGTFCAPARGPQKRQSWRGIRSQEKNGEPLQMSELGTKGKSSRQSGVRILSSSGLVILANQVAAPANAQALLGSVEKFKKFEEASEQIVASVKSGKVIDKVVQVFSSQVVVSGFSFEELKEKAENLFAGEVLDDTAMRNALSKSSSFAKETWSFWVDAILELKPVGEGLESLWGGVISLVETVIERVTAVELSVLVGIGERWLIFAPLVAIPMWWQMTRGEEDSGEAEAVDREKIEENALVQRGRVQRKLRRMKAGVALMKVLDQLGEGALEANSAKFVALRREVNAMLTLLSQELNPRSDPSLESEETSWKQREEELLEGCWKLIYVGDFPSSGSLSVSPLSLQGISSFGLRIYSGEQKVVPKSNSTRFTVEQQMAVGVDNLAFFNVTWSGLWHTETEGDTVPNMIPEVVKVVPNKVLGLDIGPLLPPLDLTIPTATQQPIGCELLYLDGDVRVDKDPNGALIVFQRV